MKEKIEMSLLQELRKLGKNNKYICKILDHLGFISLIVGIIGLFIGGILMGIWALMFGFIARQEKQKYAVLGIVLGAIDIISVMTLKILTNPDFAMTSIIRGIVFAVLGSVYILYRHYKAEKK